MRETFGIITWDYVLPEVVDPWSWRGPLTDELKASTSNLRKFIDGLIYEPRTVQLPYKQNAPRLKLPSRSLHPQTTGTAFHEAINLLLDPAAKVHVGSHLRRVLHHPTLGPA